MLISTNKIYIDKSMIGGRGVFARENIRKNEVVQIAPYIVIGDNDASGELLNYEFGHGKGKNIFCLGYGSMYNHSCRPNIEYRYSANNIPNCLDFIALRDIKKNEELFVNYGKEWWDTRSKKMIKT